MRSAPPSLLPLLLLLPACGGGGTETDPDAMVVVDPDAAPPEPDARPPAPNSVTLYTWGVEYLRYRDGDGPWQEAVELAPDRWAIRVTDHFQVLSACDEGANFSADLMATTYDASDEHYVTCYATASVAGPSQSHLVTAHVLQAGEIQMGYTVSSDTAPWDLSLELGSGTYDLAAITSDRIELRRDLAITAPVTLPTIDVDADGAPLTIAPLTVAGVGDAALTTAIDVSTANGFVWIPGSATSLRIPPAAILVETDYVSVNVYADHDGGDRSVYGPLEFGAAPPATLTLMPRLTGITYTDVDGQIEARWISLPEHQSIAFALYGDDFNDVVNVYATGAWIDRAGATAIGLRDLPDDWNAAWRIGGSTPHFRILSLYDQVDAFSYSTSSYTAVDQPASPAALRTHRAREAQQRRINARR